MELTTKDYLSHLSRHPIPEIMDDTCISALASIEKQYGDTVTHGAGLEVRLGQEARYVDYIMNIDEGSIPGVENLWYEVDYEEFQKANDNGSDITPCLFANTRFKLDDKVAWDGFLPSFLGEERAQKLRPAFDHVLENLQEDVRIKQIGTMTARGELSVMRLVISFPSWDMIPTGLADIGWAGDTVMLHDALEPWKEAKRVAVNIDLGVDGVLPKIGIEVFSRWRHPILVDRFLSRLEYAGLCLPSKKEALQRWTRILPDGEPFIQTLISYFKLNYSNGKIIEAKAYLEQSPYLHHHYFEAYEQPVWLDMELSNGPSALPIDRALDLIRECKENRVNRVRLFGADRYEETERLTDALKEGGMTAEIVLDASADRDFLSRMNGTGIVSFTVMLHLAGQSATGWDTLLLLKEMEISPVRAKIYICAENAGELEDLTKQAEELGVTELIITGMCPQVSGQHFPTREDIVKIAEFAQDYESDRDMTITVESCFSPVRACMGGADPKKNANRGIARGCEAGRSFLAVRSDGRLTPCLMLTTPGEISGLEEYWEKLAMPGSIRKQERAVSCEGCPYVRRCLPCPEISDDNETCPLEGMSN